MLPLVLLHGIACTAEPAEPADSGECATESGELPASCACDEPTVRIGGGDTSFVPATTGESTTIVHGPQGGWHILASVWLENIERIVTIRYDIALAESGELVSENEYRVQTVEVDACTGYYPGMYGYLNVEALATGEADTPPELLAGKDLLIRMNVTDAEGRAADGELSVVGALDPSDE